MPIKQTWSAYSKSKKLTVALPVATAVAALMMGTTMGAFTPQQDAEAATSAPAYTVQIQRETPTNVSALIGENARASLVDTYSASTESSTPALSREDLPGADLPAPNAEASVAESGTLSGLTETNQSADEPEAPAAEADGEKAVEAPEAEANTTPQEDSSEDLSLMDGFLVLSPASDTQATKDDKSEGLALSSERSFDRTLQSSLDNPDLYLSQMYTDSCTLCSSTMVMRRAAYLAGMDWESITEQAVGAIAWAGGLRNNFSAFGFHMSFQGLESGRGQDRVDELIRLLELHPEGIAAYDPNVPHAVVITYFDAEEGVFYAADPTPYYAGKKLPVAETWNGSCHGGDQQATINGFRSFWAIDGRPWDEPQEDQE